MGVSIFDGLGQAACNPTELRLTQSDPSSQITLMISGHFPDHCFREVITDVGDDNVACQRVWR